MKEKRRRTITAMLTAILTVFISFYINSSPAPQPNKQTITYKPAGSKNALTSLGGLIVKGRAPKTGYIRAQFLGGWGEVDGCDMRNLILRRDLQDVFVEPIGNCLVLRGELNDPYTGQQIKFNRGSGSSGAVQIDHVVALSDAWQKGAQALEYRTRNRLANDPLNLLAVDGKANQNKSDGDAATWLPSNKGYRCRYVARQIAVKLKYHLWVTFAEKDAMRAQLKKCPDQVLPLEEGLR